MPYTIILAIVVAILLVVILFWVNKEAFQDTLLSRLIGQNQDNFRVVLFYTTTCPACVALKSGPWPQLLDNYPDVTIQEVNCEEDPETCMNYNITAYPTILLFNGEKYDRYGGRWNYDELSAAIDEKK